MLDRLNEVDDNKPESPKFAELTPRELELLLQLSVLAVPTAKSPNSYTLLKVR